MKLGNYKHEDVADALEIKKMVLHQLKSIEANLWTDDIDEAIKRTVDMHLQLVNLTRMQSAKRLEYLFNQLGVKGVQVALIKFEHKKSD